MVDDPLEQLKSLSEDELEGLGEAIHMEKARRTAKPKDEEDEDEDEEESEDEEDEEKSKGAVDEEAQGGEEKPIKASWLSRLLSRKKSIAPEQTLEEELEEDEVAGDYIMAEPFLKALTESLSNRMERLEAMVEMVGDAMVDIAKSQAEREAKNASLVKSIADDMEEMGKAPQLRQAEQYRVLQKGASQPEGEDLIKKSMRAVEKNILTVHEGNILFNYVRQGLKPPESILAKLDETTGGGS